MPGQAPGGQQPQMPQGQSPVSGVMQPQDGLPQPGEKVGLETIPAPATPPAPFNNLPTDPANSVV
jgi:hypothetical protein